MKYLLNCISSISLMILFPFIDNFGMETVWIPYDYLFKVVFVGDDTVGKTQIVSKFVGKKFDESYQPTVGVEFATKVVEVKKKKIKLQLWDTAGLEKFRSITQAYYKNSKLIVLVYAVNDKNSFDNISKWVEEVKTQNKDVKFLLVGNKCDLEKEKRAVTEEEAKQYANENNMVFFEVSAKTGVGISDDMFNSIIKELLEEVKKEENNNHTYNNTNNFEQKNLLLGDQNKDSIKNKKTSCWSKYCSCCPCL